MVRGCSSPVRKVPGTYQCAEMLRMALGSGSSLASLWKPRLHSLSSIAFIGEPWPTNRTGMRCTTVGCPWPFRASRSERASALHPCSPGLPPAAPGCRSRNRMPDLPPRVFLLSPARAGGERMGLLLSPRANFSLAWDFQQKGAPVGDLFQFASGLYFRGKLAYARAFGRAPPGGF